MPTPVDKAALQRFLGMITYLSKFIDNFSDKTLPLRQLLKKDVQWTWAASFQNVYDGLICDVTTTPVLRFFDQSKSVVIQTKASSTGIEYVLFQDEQPIAYASRTLSNVECRYAQIEKELLAVVFACERFSYHVCGREITIRNDHRPLEAIITKSIHATTPRLQRMLLRFLKFNIHIVYCPRNKMRVADALSRASISVQEPSDAELQEDTEVIVHSLIQNFLLCHLS